MAGLQDMIHLRMPRPDVGGEPTDMAESLPTWLKMAEMIKMSNLHKLLILSP